MKAARTVIAIIGPTACGKTDYALALASRSIMPSGMKGAWPEAGASQVDPRLEFEIVSLDSALIYRGMDIGTAKPSAAERAQVPHHLIDICEPSESYSAADFCRDCTACIADIHARGKQVLLVGGTLMYYYALLNGMSELPSRSDAVRAALQEEAARAGWAALHARLAEIDPATAARIASQDQQRIERALEIWQLSGVPPSQLRQRQAGQKTLPFDLWTIALIPSDRAHLHQRINARFTAMVEGGFLAEVAALRTRGDLHPELPAMRAVGYRQAWVYLDALEQLGESHPPHSPAGRQALTSLYETGCAATRQLAKRQLTWLRQLKADQVIDPFRVVELLPDNGVV